ncbi:MAG TPA: PaaI family thioesterase [Candidatus Limnocylindria bacterium]|nr:PaaI family thioesterase [Candidatus Limnocylindria bacterium]
MSAAGGFWDYLGFRIESADAGEVVLRMDVPEALITPFDTVHGGSLATLLDTGLAVAVARRLDEPDRIATHALQVTYVAFTQARLLRCRARVVSLRRSIAVAEGEVVADDGTLVAKALGTFGVRRSGGTR